MKLYKSLIAIAASAAFGSCITPQKEMPLPECPPPVRPVCSPVQWSGTPYDSSRGSHIGKEWWWEFKRLQGINSRENEWGMSFAGAANAVLTYTDKDLQNSMFVRFTSVDKALPVSGIGLLLEGSIGAFAIQGKKACFSALENKPVLYTGENNNGNDSLIRFDDGHYAVTSIYEADIDGNMLKNVRNLSSDWNANPLTWQSHPALTPDGNVLFFSSNANTELGCEIMFVYKKADGRWSRPVNCGNTVNSPCDEITPFVTSDGHYLLFSSCGRDNVGGYDIFQSIITNEFRRDIKERDENYITAHVDRYFTSALNLKPPVNTPADEIFPSSPADPDSVLYYSSNQEEAKSILLKKGGYDIYVRYKIKPLKDQANKKDDFVIDSKFTEPESKNVVPEIKLDLNYTVEGQVFSRTDTLKPEKADIKVVENNSKSFNSSTDSIGKYSLNLQKGYNYEITAHSGNLFYDKYDMRMEVSDTNTVVKHDFVIPVVLTLRINFPTDVYDNPYRFVLDSNGVETGSTWQSELDRVAENILQSGGNIKKIILSGHTDEVGTEQYNLKLGQNRVNFVVSELVKRGVPPALLEAVSKGESAALAGKPGEDLKFYRKRLRRVELQKVLK